ncbi:MAG: HTH domain-containing protein, partial [Cetobacterium sp.]
MKSQIHTKHLRIIQLLKFCNGNNTEFIENILGIPKINLNNHLKDIQYSILGNSEKLKNETIIKNLLDKNYSFEYLKTYQVISKNERKFFLILKLLITRELNLYLIAKKLEVSRRTLNHDLVEVKEELQIFDLEVISEKGKGIFLKGDYLDQKQALSCYVYKYLVEEKYLPSVFYETFSFLLTGEVIEVELKKDIEKLVTDFDLDDFFYNRTLLKAFYLSFNHLDSNHLNNENNLKNKLKNKFDYETYFMKIFKNQSDLDRFYEYLHSSIFQYIDFDEIRYFLNILKICTGNFVEESIYLKDHLNIWKKIILKYCNKNIEDSEVD